MTNTDCNLPAWISYPERQIISAIITEALARSYAVSVFDGEEWTVITSTDRAMIERNIGQTGFTQLRFRSTTQRDTQTGVLKEIGSVFLVHGNGSDVIADHTDNEAMERLLKPAADLAETFSAAGI